MDLTPDETFALLYKVALDVAEERGATIPESARGTGTYAFLAQVRQAAPGLKVAWDGQRGE